MNQKNGNSNIRKQNQEKINIFFLTLLIMVILFFIPVKGSCTDYTGNCSVTFGRLMPKNKFSKAFNIKSQPELGLSFDLKKKKWPLRIAFDSSFLYADSNTSSNPYTIEENRDIVFFRSDTCLGVKKNFSLSPKVKPFLGSGVYLVRIYSKMAGRKELVAGIGYWLGAGVYFELSRHFICGFQWKQSKADIDLFGLKCNFGGNHFSLTAGYHF